MKQSKKVLFTILVALFFCGVGIFLLNAVPSDFGKRPYYNLSADQVEFGEVVEGSGYFDRWRAEMNEEEIEKVCEFLSKIHLKGKTDMENYEMRDGSFGSGMECYCLHLKNGKVIRVACDAHNSYKDAQYFCKNFVMYDLSKDSVPVCMELQLYYNQLLLKKGYYDLIQSQ